MNTKQLTAKMRVRFTVEVDAGAPWGPDARVSEIYKQAHASALQTLNAAIMPSERGALRIVGEPEFLGLITESV